MGIDKKPSFLLTNICLYNLYLLALKLLNTRSEMLYFELKLTQSKTIEWLSMSLVAHQEGGFSFFHLFGVVSGTFQRRSIFYKHRRHRVSLTCKFAMNQLLSVNNFPCCIDTCKHIELKKVLLGIKIIYFTD